MVVYAIDERKKDSGIIHSYFFDTAGNCIRASISTQRQKSSFDLLNVNYDYKNNLAVRYSPSTNKRKIKVVNQYIGDSIKYSTEFIVDSTSEVVTGYTTTYYNARKLLHQIVNYNANHGVISIFTYTYTENGLPFKIEETDIVGNLINSWLYENKYNNHGRKMNFYFIKNKERILINKCFYNERNQCIEVDCYQHNQVVYIYTFQYNIDGTVYGSALESMDLPRNSILRKRIYKYYYLNN